MRRSEIWWAELPVPEGSEPGYRHPVPIVQSEDFNRSRIRTVLALAITTNLDLARAPGNVSLARRATALRRRSVINVSQVATLDKRFLTRRIDRVSDAVLGEVEEGLRLILEIRR